MRKCVYLFSLLCFLGITLCKNALAQAVRRDSSSQQNALNNTLNYYYTSIGKQSPLYNGAEYYFYDPQIKGNAYFSEVNAFTPGSVYYDGTLYSGVPMLYDLYLDKVVVLLYNNFSKFTLVDPKVQRFDFLEHHFINISADSLGENSIIKTGFYDELYKGKSQVLARREKNIQTTMGGLNGPESYFNPVKSYFVRKKNIYYPVSGKGSLIDVFKDRKKELQQYIRASQINFRKNPEEAMVKIASYYDHLTN